MSVQKALPQATSQTYPEGSMRYNVAKLLVEHKRVTQEFLLNRLDATPRAVRGTLRDLQLAHLAECSANDERWQLTSEGMVYWTGQHMVDAAKRLAANTPAPATAPPLTQCSTLLTRSMPRIASPADRLPMVYRDGALDFKKCSRVVGPWRIYPDGTRELQDAAPVQWRTVTIPAREDHEGYSALTVTLPWHCIHCGGPRGEPEDAISYDGSTRLAVHGWVNPCGHIEKYAEIRVWLQTEGGDA